MRPPITLEWIRSRPRGFAAAVTAVFLVLGVASMLTKTPWWDEGWCASPALNLATRGSMGTSFVAPNGWLHGLDRHTYLIPPLYIVGLAGWFRMVGCGVLRMRAFSLLWGLVALAGWSAVVQRTTGRRGVALLALGLLATDYVFVSMASEGRLDMMSAALGVSSFSAYLALRERRLVAAVLAAGALAAASALTHPAGALYTAGWVVLALTYDRRRLRARHALLACVPYLAGGIAWGLYALQDPGDFMSQFGNNAHRFQGGAPLLTVLRGELNRYVRAYAYGPVWAQHAFKLQVRPVRTWPLLVPIGFAATLVASVATPALRRDPGHRALTILAVLGIAFLTFFESNKRYYHLLYVTPVFVALLAGCVAHAVRRGGRLARALAAAVAVFVALQLALIVRPIAENTFATSYRPVIAFLQPFAARQALVMGSSELAFGLGFDTRLVDDYTLGYYGGRAPDVIVINPRYHERLRDPNEPAEIRGFMERRLAAYTPVYARGTFEVYARPDLAPLAAAPPAAAPPAPSTVPATAASR